GRPQRERPVRIGGWLRCARRRPAPTADRGASLAWLVVSWRRPTRGTRPERNEPIPELSQHRPPRITSSEGSGRTVPFPARERRPGEPFAPPPRKHHLRRSREF